MLSDSTAIIHTWLAQATVIMHRRGGTVDVPLVLDTSLDYHERMQNDVPDVESERPSSQADGGSRPPISWEAHEYVHVEKTPDWYWALGLIAVAGAVAALLFENILFAIFILIASFVLAIFAARKPNVVRFSVTQRGVRIDDTLYPYQTLESFAVDEVSRDHIPKLILKPRSMLSPVLVIPIVDVSADDVHDYVRRFLEEEDHVEPLTHRLMEWLGF